MYITSSFLNEILLNNRYRSSREPVLLSFKSKVEKNLNISQKKGWIKHSRDEIQTETVAETQIFDKKKIQVRVKN